MKVSPLILFLFVATAAAAEPDLLMEPLVPPKPADVLRIETTPVESPIFTYSGREMKYPIGRQEMERFLTKGVVTPLKRGAGNLEQLAPFTPPPYEMLSVAQREWLKSGKNEQAVSAGALSTKDNRLMFWRKMNDRVLFLAQEKRGIYLVLPEGLPALGQEGEMPETSEALVVPAPGDIVTFENAPVFSRFYLYSSLEVRFPLDRSEFDKFLRDGVVTSPDASRDSIKGGTFTPSANHLLDEREKNYIRMWDDKTSGAVCLGAVLAGDGRIYFWRKLSDEVLFLSSGNRGEWLVLPHK